MLVCFKKTVKLKTEIFHWQKFLELPRIGQQNLLKTSDGPPKGETYSAFDDEKTWGISLIND